MSELNELALLVKLGIASPDQAEQVGQATLAACLTVARLACRAGFIQYADIQDVAMNAVTRTYARCQTWDPTRAGWKTFASCIAQSEVGNQRRRYAHQGKVWAAAVKAADESDLDDNNSEGMPTR